MGKIIKPQQMHQNTSGVHMRGTTVYKQNVSGLYHQTHMINKRVQTQSMAVPQSNYW